MNLHFCTERGRLLDLLAVASSEYASLANEYASLTTKIAEQAETMPLDGYRNKRSEVEHARIRAEGFRDALLLHRKEHGC